MKKVKVCVLIALSAGLLIIHPSYAMSPSGLDKLADESLNQSSVKQAEQKLSIPVENKFILKEDPITHDKNLLIPNYNCDPYMLIPGDSSIDPGILVDYPEKELPKNKSEISNPSEGKTPEKK